MYNVGPTSSRLVQHCTNAIQMFLCFLRRLWWWWWCSGTGVWIQAAAPPGTQYPTRRSKSDTPPAMGQCWANVYDGGPALPHRWNTLRIDFVGARESLEYPRLVRRVSHPGESLKKTRKHSPRGLVFSVSALSNMPVDLDCTSDQIREQTAGNCSINRNCFSRSQKQIR